MRIRLGSMLIICLLIVQFPLSHLEIAPVASCVTVDTFDNNVTEMKADLTMPDRTVIINLSLPTECHILTAIMNVSNVLNDSAAFLDDVTLSLESNTIWSFNGTSYGELGLQKSFSNNSQNSTLDFGNGGGSGNATIRLPKKAVVQNASMEIHGAAPRRIAQVQKFDYGENDEHYRSIVASAGDVNGDGFDDVLIGDPFNTSNGQNSGSVCLFHGGKQMDSKADLVFPGPSSNADFGYSAAGGDFNGDGYSDVIIGAPEYPSGSWIGAASLYFGGPNMDTTPDLIFKGTNGQDQFGISLADAGDVNGDGYDDLIIGASSDMAYIFFGGPNLGTSPNITITHGGANDYFGNAVAGAGDVNGDGYDDVIIGAWQASGQAHASGAAYIVFGGQTINSTPDVNLTGYATGDDFGRCVATAGDVNKDGYDDVIVGADHSGGFGRAYLFFGGPIMDNSPDLIIQGQAQGDHLGVSVSKAGDFNQDGYADFIVGAEDASDSHQSSGSAYLFFGGPNLSETPDVIFSAEEGGVDFGHSIAFVNDVNHDGPDDILILDPGVTISDNQAGAAYLYSDLHGIERPNLLIGSETIWNYNGFFNSTDSCQNLSGAINDYLKTAIPSGSDSYANRYVNMSVTAMTESGGSLEFSNLSIEYSYETTVPDFSVMLNLYISRHKMEKDVNGNITVPLKLTSMTPGAIKLSNLTILTDDAPVLMKSIPNLEIDEDTSWMNLLDLHEYFIDDFDSVDQMTFSLVSATNSSIVNVEITGNQYLTVDTLENLQNMSWSGIVTMVVSCSDHWGSMTFSNPFDVVVKHVNHPPVITSVPNVSVLGGQRYEYQVLATDIDNDTLAYNLTSGPENMTLNQTTGLLQWVPEHWGRYPVVLTVSDGLATVPQQFNIIVLNRPPRLMSQTIPIAFVGRPFTYVIPAIDDDCDTLEYTLFSNPIGMQLGSSTGELTWTPWQIGDFPVSVKISDSQDHILDNFTITVVQGNRAPVIHSTPALLGISGVPYNYKVNATDADNDMLNYSLVIMPECMTIDASSGLIAWTPVASGNYSVKVRVFDGKDGEAVQAFIISVAEKVLPTVQIIKPIDGQTIRGKYIIQGTVIKGTLEVVKIQFRIDNNAWMNTTGNNTWSYVLDTTTLSNSKHVFEVRAFDGTDYSNATASNFMINNTNNQSAGSISLSLGIGGIVAVVCILILVIIILKKRKYGKRDDS